MQGVLVLAVGMLADQSAQDQAVQEPGVGSAPLGLLRGEIAPLKQLHDGGDDRDQDAGVEAVARPLQLITDGGRFLFRERHDRLLYAYQSNVWAGKPSYCENANTSSRQIQSTSAALIHTPPEGPPNGSCPWALTPH